jgi:PAS domain S-box-containing protein
MDDQNSPIPAEPPGGLDARFRALMDTSPVMIWVSGADGRCIWFNKSWLAFTGRTMAEEVGDGWAAGVHGEDTGRCQETYATHFAAREPFRRRYRLRRDDGAYRWIDDVGLPRYDAEGRFLGFAGSCSDIHEQVEAEAELGRLRTVLDRQLGETTTQLASEITAHHETERSLQRSSAQLELMIQGIHDYAIFMLDPAGRISSWNSGAERIKGYREEEVVGRHFSLFYTEEDRAADVPERALRQAETEGRFEAEGWRVRKGGNRFWASVVIDPIFDAPGTLIGFGKVTRDMTEKRLAQEHLERVHESMLQMQRMEAIGQLTGGIAHDFNNLLMVILGNLDIAQRRSETEGGSSVRMQRAIANAILGAQRAATLTQRLLAFSRRQPLDPRFLDLNRFVAGEMEFLRRTLGETVKVEMTGGAGLWNVEVDVSQFEAALLNLVVNARDAMPDGGRLVIETGNVHLDEEYCRANADVQRGDYVMMSVADSGTGMTPEVAARAFEPFFSTKAVGYGTGLGLSQVYGFIKQSGGHVRIDSTPGEGATVRIYLPRGHASGAAVEQEDSHRTPGGGAGETILVVEDDEDVRAYLIETLRELNYRVLPAPDAEAALTLIGQPDTPIDLLLSDIVLPGMNGRELARRAQVMRDGLKVLFMTGYSRDAIVHQGRLEADVELVQKPVTRDQLAARIGALLEAGRA